MLGEKTFSVVEIHVADFCGKLGIHHSSVERSNEGVVMALTLSTSSHPAPLPTPELGYLHSSHAHHLCYTPCKRCQSHLVMKMQGSWPIYQDQQPKAGVVVELLLLPLEQAQY